MDGSRGNAGRLKGAHPQLGPHQRQRRHMLGAQQMVSNCERFNSMHCRAVAIETAHSCTVYTCSCAMCCKF